MRTFKCDCCDRFVEHANTILIPRFKPLPDGSNPYEIYYDEGPLYEYNLCDECMNEIYSLFGD